VGILICLISCAFYVATWEILYFGVMPDLGDKLEASMVQQAKNEASTPPRRPSPCSARTT
jgi:hypothetical protein